MKAGTAQIRISFEIKGVERGSPLTLLDFAQGIVSKKPDKYKHVWLVYDKDDFPPDDFDNYSIPTN